MKNSVLNAEISRDISKRRLFRPFIKRIVAIILLMIGSTVLLPIGINAFSSNQITDADGAVHGEDTFVIDIPRNGIAPYDGSNACIEESEVSVSANAAFLCTAGGQVLFSKRQDEKLPMASITKVMTALVVIENVRDLQKTVKVSPLAVGIEGSSVYLKTGDAVTVLDLLYALMLSSANDAAVALAVDTAGSVEAFVSLMNRKATTLGMSSTAFVNPHGLRAEGHYTTAREYGRLMANAIKNSVFKDISGTLRKNIYVNGVVRSLYNHNRLLYSCDGVFCGKTGYTVSSGRTLVTVAERNGATLICVTLNAPDDWNDHKKLYDIGFSRVSVTDFKTEDLSFKLPIVGSDIGYENVTVSSERNIRVVLIGDKTEFELKYCYPIFAYAPISKGERIGYIKIVVDSGWEHTVSLVSLENIPAQNETKGVLWRLNAMWKSLTNKEKENLHNE